MSKHNKGTHRPKRMRPPNALLALRKRIRRRRNDPTHTGPIMTTATANRLVEMTRAHREKKHKGHLRRVVGEFGV